MKKSRFIKRLLISIGFLLFLAFFLIKKVNPRPFKEESYYTETLQALDSCLAGLDTSKKIVFAGWSKKNITPKSPVRIVGYGLQDDFKTVNDSIHVRTTVFAQGKKKYALISYDLLFIHPNITLNLEKSLTRQNVQLDGIYYTATHTHNSFGGWGFDRYFDDLLLDGEENHIMDLIINQSVESIKEAITRLDTTLISTGSFNFKDFIRNRIPDEEFLDPWIHTLQLIHPTKGDTSLITTFSAHATCLFSIMDENILSGDYPGMMSSVYESTNKKQFTFCAGGVASFSPRNTKSAIPETQEYAMKMLLPLLDSISTKQSSIVTSLQFFKSKLKMPEPIFRISENYQLKPWLFKQTIGFIEPEIAFLRIGTSIFIGFPGEISGELYQDEIQRSKEKNVSLIVTSLNGNYTGYAMPEDYYHEKTCHELRDMNWFGPQSGNYFKTLIQEIVNHIN